MTIFFKDKFTFLWLVLVLSPSSIFTTLSCVKMRQTEFKIRRSWNIWHILFLTFVLGHSKLNLKSFSWNILHPRSRQRKIMASIEHAVARHSGNQWRKDRSSLCNRFRSRQVDQAIDNFRLIIGTVPPCTCLSWGPLSALLDTWLKGRASIWSKPPTEKESCAASGRISRTVTRTKIEIKGCTCKNHPWKVRKEDAVRSKPRPIPDCARQLLTPPMLAFVVKNEKWKFLINYSLKIQRNSGNNAVWDSGDNFLDFCQFFISPMNNFLAFYKHNRDRSIETYKSNAL